MAQGFLDIATTPSVRAAQRANGSDEFCADRAASRVFERFGASEAAFIASRDSLYLATVSESGWPYVQHRGGPAGFLKMLDDRTLGMADFRGNRQYITLGNLAASDKASLFLMDYPRKARLKIFARVEAVDLAARPDLSATLGLPGYRAKVERGFLFHLEAFDWNCSQHITPRFTEAELAPALAPLRERLAELEAENAALRQSQS